MMKSSVGRCGVPLLFMLVAVVSQPCENDNVCSFQGNCNNNNKCVCVKPRFGSRCQYLNTDVPCANNADCKNGGDCQNYCICKDYWYGPTCEIVCPGDPPICLNGGSCRVDNSRNDGFNCDCTNGFSGKFCETANEPECDPACQSGGTCDYIQSGSSVISYCNCPEGFTGLQCQEEVGTCDPLCLNGETCDLAQGCICPSAWTGSSCEDSSPLPPTPPCASGPCLNGGTCVDQPDNMFRCECPGNYGGMQCMDPAPSPCDSNLCSNGGTCEANADNSAYSCICTVGYSGMNCDNVQSPCQPNPCQNGGTCGEVQDSFTCDCATGFSGTSCQVTVSVDGGGGNNAAGAGATQTIIIIVAAGALAVIVLVIVVICVVCLCCLRRKKPTQRSKKSKAKRMTNIPPATSHRDVSPRQHKNHQPENNYIAMTTPRKNMEFPRRNLKFLEHIGSGAFATVYKAEAYSIIKPRQKTIVAVKVLKENASENDRKDFMKELSLFKALGKHEHLVAMYGCCTDKDPVYLIMEFLPKGNLQQHLRSMVNTTDGTYANKMAQHQLSPSELLNFGIQISKGMEFLDSKKCVHRDLAARNILLGDGFICKIADFGLARDLADSQEYEMKSKGRVPVRWMAPESLMQNMYTTKSDAWSFGIVMWEIITLGSHPYPGMSPRQVMQSVQNGYRLPQPDHCNDEIYSLLEHCWKQEPANRPSFTEIRMSLEQMMEADQGYLQMDNFHQDNYMYLEPDAALAEEL